MTSALVTTYPHADRPNSASRTSQTDWLPGRAPASDGLAKGRLSRGEPVVPGASGLPKARSVLAVTARPGVESADLGGLLYAFGKAGARLTLLSLTSGEASAFNSTNTPLKAVRPWELQLASWLLGISSVAVADYPDGALRYCPMPDLAERVRRAITEHAPDLILVLDPSAGNSDDTYVARAVSLAAGSAGVPVAARTMPGASGSWTVELGAEAGVARDVQRAAARAHASQSETLPEVLASLDSFGGREQLRWLVPAVIRPPAQRAVEARLN
jgi:LmbE family N-acetylglucosaminyl deacetylase